MRLRGIPVSIVHLAAHLDTYDAMKPNLFALRLCNQFGKGERAFVTTLPTELVDLVGGYLLEMERDLHLERWRRSYACFQQTCGTLDHYHEDSGRVSDLQKARHDLYHTQRRVKVGSRPECYPGCPCANIRDDDDALVKNLGQSDVTVWIHEDMVEAWPWKVSLETARPIYNEHRFEKYNPVCAEMLDYHSVC